MEGKATVIALCDLFGVARSTYYRWKKKWGNANTDELDERSKLEQKIEHLCIANEFRYGYRTIQGLLHQDGWKVNRKTVQRIMQKHGWNCRVKVKKRKKTGQPHYVASNLLEREFFAEAPLQKLVTDIISPMGIRCFIYLRLKTFLMVKLLHTRLQIIKMYLWS